MTASASCTTIRPRRAAGVSERGWLSSNNLLVHAADGEPGATLIDILATSIRRR